MIEAPRDLPLSAYIRDPFVREAFRRAEGDGPADDQTANLQFGRSPRPRPLAGGAVVEPQEMEMVDA